MACSAAEVVSVAVPEAVVVQEVSAVLGVVVAVGVGLVVVGERSS